MICSKYVIKETGIDHDVCHLFEHLVLHSFLIKLKINGYHRGLFGWLNGLSSDSDVEFDLAVYRKQVKDIFEDHIANLPNFSKKLVDDSIKHIEAEMRVEVIVEHQDLLNKQLLHLQSLLAGKIKDAPIGKSISVIPSRRNFTSLAVFIKGTKLTDNEIRLFYYSYPFIIDVLADEAVEHNSLYSTGVTCFEVSECRDSGFIWRLSANKNVDANQINGLMSNALNKFNPHDYSHQINDYFLKYKRNSRYKSVPAGLLMETGMETTNPEIVEIATAKSIEDLLEKLEIHVYPWNKKMNMLNWR
jgi:hypothetical protein